MKNKPRRKTTKAVWKATKPTWRDHLGSLVGASACRVLEVAVEGLAKVPETRNGMNIEEAAPYPGLPWTEGQAVRILGFPNTPSVVSSQACRARIGYRGLTKPQPLMACSW